MTLETNSSLTRDSPLRPVRVVRVFFEVTNFNPVDGRKMLQPLLAVVVE